MDLWPKARHGGRQVKRIFIFFHGADARGFGLSPNTRSMPSRAVSGAGSCGSHRLYGAIAVPSSSFIFQLSFRFFFCGSDRCARWAGNKKRKRCEMTMKLKRQASKLRSCFYFFRSSFHLYTVFVSSTSPKRSSRVTCLDRLPLLARFFSNCNLSSAPSSLRLRAKRACISE